jgi:hypothetical protein
MPAVAAPSSCAEAQLAIMTNAVRAKRLAVSSSSHHLRSVVVLVCSSTLFFTDLRDDVVDLLTQA